MTSRSFPSQAADDFGGRFGPLELQVLESLWARGGPVSVRDLQCDFPRAAYTTLMTTLDRLFRKGVLEREKAGRAFVYRPRYTREALRSGLAEQALGSLLGPDAGSVRPILSCFVDVVSRTDRALLDDLARLIEAKRKAAGDLP
jgi:predicted transcriptional regulator